MHIDLWENLRGFCEGKSQSFTLLPIIHRDDLLLLLLNSLSTTRRLLLVLIELHGFADRLNRLHFMDDFRVTESRWGIYTCSILAGEQIRR